MGGREVGGIRSSYHCGVSMAIVLPRSSWTPHNAEDVDLSMASHSEFTVMLLLCGRQINEEGEEGDDDFEL
jgi:hypothetical protein